MWNNSAITVQIKFIALFLCFQALVLGAKVFGAPVPYAGKVAINGLNFSENAPFTFALRDSNGTIRWRNGADANATINVPVDRGHFLASSSVGRA